MNGQSSSRPKVKSGYLASMLSSVRLHQWLKNVLIFVPMIAGHSFGFDTFTRSLVAFLAFCLVASSVYLVNDIMDIEADRQHPRKQFRAIASGAFPAQHARILAAILIGAGAIIALTLNVAFFSVVACYFAVTLAYTLKLKQIFVTDIFTLAGLYTIRIVAGSAATGIVLSNWIIAFSIFVFFALAALKRLVEVSDSKSRGVAEIAGRNYNADDLHIVGSMAIASGYISVLVLALYVNSPNVAVHYSNPLVLLSTCGLHFFWINHMIVMSHRKKMHDDPLVFAVKDPTSLVVAALGAVSVVMATQF
jgi:4-hydroxybenzoate polyprenyltransferase